MALTYNTILRQVMVATNGMVGTSQLTLEGTYTTVPLSSSTTLINSALFPFTGYKDKILNAEATLVALVAAIAGHPWRGHLLTQTANLAYGAQIPTTVGSAKIIGIRGDVRDASDNEPCIEADLGQIQDRKFNPNSMWKIPAYWFAIKDQRIYHTRTNVKVDVCTYTRPVADSLTLSTNVILPDEAAPAYVYGSLMECIRDDEFMEQGARFGAAFTEWIAGIRSGFASAIAAAKEAR